MSIELIFSSINSLAPAQLGVVARILPAALEAWVQALLGWIQQTALSTVLRNSDWAIMTLESVHLLGLVLLGGVATLLGIAALRRHGLRGLSVAELARGLLPLLTAGLVIMIASGALIAWSMPYRYYPNEAFRLKMLFLVLAVVSTVWLGVTVKRRGSSVAQRARAALAFLLWFAVGLSGRWIGFF